MRAEMIEEDFEYIEGNKEAVCVNVAVFTYNHSSFIRKAMDSIFMQKTKYSYNVIIGEDCSTDDTRDILMEYYEKYPDKINLILWNHNAGMDRNEIEVLKKCKGKYIAYLEGDDYWTDACKLEKQVSFMEDNEQYIGTAHNVRCVDKNGDFLHRDYGAYPYKEDHIYDLDNVKRMELVGQTAGMVYRNIWTGFRKENWEKYFTCEANGDLKVSLMLGSLGKVYFFQDIMADHRRVFEGDSWTAQAQGKDMRWIEYQMRCQIRQYMLSEFNVDLGDTIRNLAEAYYKESVVQMLRNPRKESVCVCIKFYWEKYKYGKKQKGIYHFLCRSS